jgi:hypothetical protein
LSVVLAWLAITVSFGKTDKVIQCIKSFITGFNLTDGCDAVTATECSGVWNRPGARVVTCAAMVLKEILACIVLEVLVNGHITIIVQIVASLSSRNGSIAEPPLSSRTGSRPLADAKLI